MKQCFGYNSGSILYNKCNNTILLVAKLQGNYQTIDSEQLHLHIIVHAFFNLSNIFRKRYLIYGMKSCLHKNMYMHTHTHLHIHYVNVHNLWLITFPKEPFPSTTRSLKSSSVILGKSLDPGANCEPRLKSSASMSALSVATLLALVVFLYSSISYREGVNIMS